MTQVGELLYKEGREEGSAQAKQEVAKKLLAKGMDIAFIALNNGPHRARS